MCLDVDKQILVGLYCTGYPQPHSHLSPQPERYLPLLLAHLPLGLYLWLSASTVIASWPSPPVNPSTSADCSTWQNADCTIGLDLLKMICSLIGLMVWLKRYPPVVRSLCKFTSTVSCQNILPFGSRMSSGISSFAFPNHTPCRVDLSSQLHRFCT